VKVFTFPNIQLLITVLLLIGSVPIKAMKGLWRPSHGGITTLPLTEKILLKACPEAKDSSPTIGLLIVRPVI
jgi:hypothetical protein